MKLFYLILSSLLCISLCAQKQDRPVAFAQKTDAKFDIDGHADEPAWQDAAVLSNFIENNPNPGDPCSKPTEVRVLYSDEGVYVHAMMYDDPDSLIVRMTPRDQVRNTDWFSISLDTYNAGNNGYIFGASVAGVQYDIRVSSDDGDSGWNAVWENKSVIRDDGWSVEIFIPYNAVRFAEAEVQDWGINFARNIESIREVSHWSYIDPNVNGFINQWGTWTGIKDIESPLRLTLFPFVATNFSWLSDKNADPKNLTEFTITGGADIKYGINDAFTLDMTLIPDFSQARSDNAVLNLSPFEVQFDEQRQFFQEGIELFNRANIFFTRRIGGKLALLNEVQEKLPEGQYLSNVPSNSRLLNISKLTGRTEKGLGVGVLNAISEKTVAQILGGDEPKEVVINPFTNYNVFVLDQNLKNNSYVSLINTSVLRKGDAPEANVTATEFRLQDSSITWQLQGSGAISQLYGSGTTDLGHRFALSGGKTSGNFVFDIGYEETANEFEINDLGFQRLRNYREIEWFGAYRNFDPKGNFNFARYNFGIEYETLRSDWQYSNLSLFQNQFYRTNDFLGFGRFTYTEPFGTHDYFEPRTSDFSLFLANPGLLVNGGFFSTNYSKDFAIDIDFSHYTFFEKGRHGYDFSFQPRLRVWDRMIVELRTAVGKNKRDVGFVPISSLGIGYSLLDPSGSYMSRRDRLTVSNIFTIDYSVNPNLNINFRLRHIWDQVDVLDVYQLGENGELVDILYNGTDEDGNQLHDINFNALNIDMVLTWRFAPGSDLIFVWKDAIATAQNELLPRYFDNLDRTLQSPQLNTFTLKAVYFLDYYSLKKKDNSTS